MTIRTVIGYPATINQPTLCELTVIDMIMTLDLESQNSLCKHSRGKTNNTRNDNEELLNPTVRVN